MLIIQKSVRPVKLEVAAIRSAVVVVVDAVLATKAKNENK